MTDRYEGKPFLRLLDCWVLDAIGHLDEQQASALGAMEPKLAATFGKSGAWQDIVSAQMEFPEHLPEKIRDIWENGCAKAAEAGVSVDAREFTRQFVDTNFGHWSETHH